MNRMSKRTALRVCLGLALAAAVGLSASAQEVKKVEQRRISLRLQKAEVAKVLPQLVQSMDARLDMECDRDPTVTIAFENLTVPTALTAICESAGLQWQLVESPERVVKVTCAPEPPPPGPDAQRMEVKVKREVAQGGNGHAVEKVSLDVHDAKAPDVFGVTAQLLGAKLLMDSSLGGKTVTYQAKDEAIPSILDNLCKQIGAKWELVPGTPATLKVSPL